MQIDPTALPEVLILTPRRLSDARGWFMETWNGARMADAGLDLPFVQDNHSFSAAKGTLRGLHVQSPPRAQDKLVRCSRGAILDVAVDIRTGSPTYGQHVAVDFVSRLRGQVKFGSVDDLIEAMHRDTDRARTILAAQA